MYKILISLFVMILVFPVAAQVEDQTLTKSTVTEQTNFSESIPYQPREFQLIETTKKKNKKPDNNTAAKITDASDGKNSTAAIDDGRIRIPFFVYEKSGKTVTDLKISDITLLIDGKEEPFTEFEFVNTPLNLLLVLDTSSSIAYKKENLRNVVKSLVEALKPEDKLQILTFNEKIKVLTEMTNNPEILLKTVKKIEIGSGTSLYDSIQIICRKYLSAMPRKPTVILITDGVDTISQKANYQTSLVEAELINAVFFPFYFDTYEESQKITSRNNLPGLVLGSLPGVGTSKAEYALGRAYLQDIADFSGGRTFIIKSLTDIKKENFEKVFRHIQPHYIITAKSAENSQTFQRKQIKVRVNRPNLIIKSRGSYVSRLGQ